MKRTRAERRAVLEAKAKELIDELMAWDEETERPTLTQMEDEVLKLRQELSEAMLESLVEGQESQKPVPGPSCAQCGREMEYKGDKPRQVTSRAGELHYERGYYYCSGCKERIFPPRSTTPSVGETPQ